MLHLNPLEPGVMYWAGRDTPEEVQALGVRCAQLGIADGVPLTPAHATGLIISTVFAAYEGEDYADIPTASKTVGFAPLETRAKREARTFEVIDYAAELKVPSFACHIGQIEEDPEAMRDLVRRICDRCAAHGMTFALETGQESAEDLLQFMEAVNRPNLGINFDPANMILYGTGDPIEAYRRLAPRVLSIHAKDAIRPDPKKPAALGTESPLGQGEVNMPSFLEALEDCNYQGQLFIEREGTTKAQWSHDVTQALKLLQSLCESPRPLRLSGE